MPMSCTSAQNYSRTANIPGQAAATIAFWYQPSTTASAYAPICALFRNASGREIGIIAQNGTALDLFWTNGGASSSNTFGTVAANTWYYIALTSGGTAIGALDGYVRSQTATSFTTVANTSTVDSLAPDRIFLNEDGYGSGGVQTKRFANLKVWDRVLTTDELYQEMQVSMPTIYESINLWCPLDDATTDQDDYGPNNRDLTVTGTPTAFTTDAPAIPFIWEHGTEWNWFEAAAVGGSTQPPRSMHQFRLRRAA